MANKVAFALVFSLMIVVSIRSAVGSTAETFDQGMHNFQKTTGAAAERVSHAASDAAEKAKDTSKTWTDWVKDKFD